jgi:non-specific serine/threonine protein kinase
VGGQLGPGPAGAIIGREAEIAALGSAFAAGARLITLTGLGGIGKTTIATALAASQADDRGGARSVAFVDLAPVRDANDVLPTIAGTVGAAGDEPEELESAVLHALGRTPTLLVLDNFEHVLAARDVVQRLLDAAAAGLAILVTSRVAIGLPDERRVQVAPLGIPSSPEELGASGAGRLLLERAHQRGGLRSGEADDAAALVEICRHLDGIPLALELAAGWTGLLSPRAILRRLDERRLRLAASGTDRHATMERVVESTLELLEPDDRRAFEAVSIFPAPFDEPGARAVTGVDDVLPVLRRLDAIALLQPIVEVDGEPRFRILEPIRMVGEGRLGSRTDLEAVERRFVGQAASRAQEAADALRDVHPRGALDWMAAEHPNLSAALGVATRLEDAPSSVQLAMTLATFEVRAGNARKSLERLRAALAMGQVPAVIRSEALCAVVNLCVMTSEDADLVAMCREAIDLARAAGDGRREARALIALGSYGPPEDGDRILTEAIESATAIGYTWAALAAMDNLASLRAERGEWRGALALLEQSFAIATDAGDTDGIGFTLSAMADLTAKLGQIEEAHALAVRGSAAYRVAWPQSAALAWSLAVLATCESLTGRHREALATLVEACATAELAESTVAIADVLEAAVHVLADPAPELVARLGGRLAVHDAAGERRRARSPITMAALGRARRVVGARRFERAEATGRVADGRTLLGEAQAAAAGLMVDAAQVSGEYGSLTRRETEVLTLLSKGRTDGQIGAELGMSAKTASVHVANIKSKLGVETRVDAAMRARELLASGPASGRR